MPQAQTVTIAQALQSNLSGLTVQDTAANIAQALPDPALVARVGTFELSGPATIAATAADQLATLGAKFTPLFPITVQDTLAAMTAPANAAGLALASTRIVADAAYNLLAAAPSAFTGIGAVILTGSPSLSAAQLLKLESLPGFTIPAATHFAFADALAAASPVLVAHPAWFAQAASITVRLDGSQVSAGVASALAALATGGRSISFTPGAGDTTLNINAAAHDLATAAASLNRIGQLVPLRITVANDGSAISAADAVALTTINGFAPAQHALTVADTGAAITAAGAALFNHGYPQITVTSGNFSGIAAQLLDPTLRVAAGATVTMTGTPILNAAQIQILAALPGFALAQGATLTVNDTISHILAHAGALAPATAIALTDSETVTAASLTALAQIAAAHAGAFSLAGHAVGVADSAANLLTLTAPAIALASGFSLTAGGNVTAAQFAILRNGLNVAANGFTVTVTDTAANLLGLSGNLSMVGATQLSANANIGAAQVLALAAEPNFTTGGHALTVTDNAAALLALPGAVRALANQLVLAGSQSVSAAQAIALAALGASFATGSASLTVTDTAANLLALPVGVNAIASFYALSADATVNAAQFIALYSPLHVSLNGHALTVTDSAANLLTIPGQALGQASAFLLGANGTVNEAQFATLRDTLQLGANGHSLTVADTASHLLALSGNLSLIGATQLTADASLTAAQAQTLAADPGFSTAGNVLTITDSAANLLALPGAVTALAGHLLLAADQSVTAAQAAGLAALGSAFSTAGHALTVTDTAAALLALPLGVGAIATSYVLSTDAAVTAAGFTALSGLGVSLNGHALTVSDTPANLLALPPQGLGLATGFTLSAGGTVTEAQFVALRDVLHVAANGNTLTVADTAADLLALSGNLSLDGATHMTADASVTASQAQTLAADPQFSTGGHVLTVIDTAANLLALPGAVQALSGHLVLAASQTVTAAQAAGLLALGAAFSTGGQTLTVTDTASALLALPQGVTGLASLALSADATVTAAQFLTLTTILDASLNGHALTVSDTPANLLTLPAGSLSQISAVTLSAGGTVSESQFLTLRDTLGIAGNGHALTVADTAANLLALSGNLTLVSATALTAPANVSAAQAVQLAAEPGFSTAGQVLTITDNAANLLALPPSVQTLSGHLALAASQNVSASQAIALAALGSAFATNGQALTVTDTAAALLALPPGANALASAYALSADAAVTAAQFAILEGAMHAGLNGHSLTVSDTPAALLALQAQLLGDASAFALSASGTVSLAQFVTLRDVLGVAGNGHTLTVADTAANLLALSGSLSLVGATMLTADANLTAAQAQILAAEPGFATGGHVLTVTDSAANLLALPPAVQALSGHLVLAASQSVSAAQITALAGLGAEFSAGGNTLTVTDTAANLLALPAGAMALAGAYALSADATVTAAQFTTLYATLNVGLNGHALVVSDTAANLLALPPQALSHATGFALSANGAVNESQFVTLRDTLGVSGAGHTLSVTDSAANLLALGGNLSLIGATLLAGNASVTAAQAQILAADPGFSVNGHVLTVTDSAANLLSLPTGVQTLSGHLVLAASQSVSAAQASGLAALGAIFSTGGNTLTVTDTAANLLSLPGGVAGIAGGYALSANGTVNAAGFTALYGTLHVALNGYALTVADTPANLLTVPLAGIPEASFALSSGGTVSEAQFVTLRDTIGVNANGHTLTVSDTAQDLLALSGNLALDGATQLSADATVSAAQAIALAAEPGFATVGHVLTIADTAANLLALPTQVQTLSGHLVLSASQSVSAAQASGLAALGAAFSTGGHTLTVTDTAANLLSLPAGVGPIAGAYALSADATVTAAQFTTLRDGLHIALNGHDVTILDSAANLAGLTGSLADASACILSASGTVSAAGAAVLNAEPGFSNGGHSLTIADTASNLLALGAPLQALANAFTLSANQTVSAAQLAGLAGYGIKFTNGAYTLGVADTAANLAALTAPELALVGGETMTQSATVSAATAATLAGLPGFALGSGAVMTVQDSAANLLALPPAVQAVASAEILPAGAVTLSAVQAAGLNALAHFSTAGSTITVLDTVAALNGNAGWANVAVFTHVVDTAATLAANAASPLLQTATSVTLLGNATVTAAQAAALATVGGYSTGAATLTVADSAASIAQNEGAINAVATVAVVNTNASVTAAQADALALLSSAGKLNVLAGDTLTIADSFAALTASGNAPGLALASNIMVTDSAANLVTAASYNWGSVAPTYVLAANAIISGAQAVVLAGLGSHLLLNGHTLAVQDSAANVAADASSLTALGISATVVDSAANIGGQAAALQAMGARLAAVQVTDAGPVTPAVAAGLAPLAAKLTGSPVQVAGAAAAIDANIAALHTLGSHASIALTDSAANVGTYVSDLATLGASLTVTLTDASPVSAATAAGVEPLTARLATFTSLAVTDTAADIAGQAGTLAAMGNAIGTISLSGGNAVSVAQAAALLPLQTHLGNGVQLAASGNAASITANLSSLLTLHADGRLASVTDGGESIATVLAAATALNMAGATVNVSDTLADFNASGAGLSAISGLAAITISDTPHPVFALSLAQYSAEAGLLGLVTNAHTIAITDAAAAIEADLAAGNASILTGIAAQLTLAVTGGAPLVLSQAVATAPAVAAVLADFTGTLQVTGVDVAHVNAVAALSPAAITVTDSTADIAADLTSGNSALLAHVAAIASITATGGGTISLTAGQALTANVDDGPGSVFGKLSGAGLVVSGATVSQVPALLGAALPPASISISDTAANITAALINPASPVMTAPNTILSLHVSDGAPITLTEAQDVAAGVNDGPNAALTKVSGAAIDVTGVTAAQLAAVEGGAVVPTQIGIADTASDIAGALATLLADRANLGPITLTSGTPVLTFAQATMAHVADGAGSLVSLLPGHTYWVGGATVAQIGTLMALAQAPAAIAVSDSSANVAADIAGAGSQILAHATSVSVAGGTLSLTDAQAHAVLSNGNGAALGLLGSGQTIDITGVPVADIAGFSALAGSLAAGVTLHLEVSDNALALAGDLAQGAGSVLTTDAAYVNSVTLTGAGGTLTPAQLTAVAGIGGLNANGVTVPVSGDASDIAGLGAAARALAGAHVTVNDTSGGVAAVLGTLHALYGGNLAITLSNPGGLIGQTASQFATNLSTINAITNSACVTVTGGAAAIAAIEPALAANTHVAGVQVSDIAANIVNNLSAIAALGAAATVTLTDPGSISAAVAQALVNQNLAHLNAGSVTVGDTGSQIAAMAESGAADVSFLTAQGATLTADSNVGLVDAQALHGLGGALATNGHTINVWDTAAHLTAPGAAAALSALGGFVGGVYLKAPGGTVSLTAATALALLAIPGLSIDNPDTSVNTITVADTAAHLEGNIAALESDAPSISAFVINASATVTAATLTDMQTLGATTAPGVALTLSDTAANILTAAGVNGASVQASAWILSANAAVSSANALTLAALPNFSPAGHTLTVALGSDTPVASVAQANQLGALGSDLVVTGHEYTMSGSVAALTGLTAAGAAVAHVALSDTFSNLSGLPPTSPLLTGTIAVTDAESLTASQAQSFLALLSAAGVADGNVSFTGGAEIVTDTVANLQALTASAAWTGNPALHAHLSLVANDNAATLDNPANAAFLDTLSGQVLTATATVSAASATALSGLSNFSLGGHSLIVSDSAANLLNGTNGAGLALATSIHLSGAASLNAAQAEQLLQTNHFTLTQPLSITDSSTNLLDGTLSGLIAGHNLVQVALAGPETLDAPTASALVALQGFSDSADMNIVDSSSYLLAPGASAAEAMAASVALAGSETVSANTVLRLSEIPHFITGGGTLTLAGDDYANAPTLKAIADMGTHFSEGGHNLNLTQDDLGLTPAEYAAIQADGFVANGHVISAELVNGSVTDTNNTMSLTASGVTGASVNVYDHSGALLSTTNETTPSFTVTAPDGGSGNNFSITETVGGVESAPVVVLNASTLEGLVTNASASFSNTGQIQVGAGEYLNLYTAGASLPNAPALVYDPNAHTISLDIPNASPVVLITLGAGTHPASIDPSEILVKHHA